MVRRIVLAVGVACAAAVGWGDIPLHAQSTPYTVVYTMDFHSRYGIACGTGILRTTDGGATWEEIPVPADLRSVKRDVWIIDSSRAVIAGSGFIAFSTDGGSTWSRATGDPLLVRGPHSGDAKALSFDGRYGVALVYTRTGEPKLLYTSNAGRTWRAAPEPPSVGATRPTWRFLAASRRRGILLAGTHGLWVRGATATAWEQVTVMPGAIAGPTIHGLAIDKDYNVWVSCEGQVGHAAWTTSGVGRFTFVPAPAEGTLVVRNAVAGKPPALAIAGGTRPHVSADGGKHWTTCAVNPPGSAAGVYAIALGPSLIATAPPTAFTLWVGGIGTRAAGPHCLWAATIGALIPPPRGPLVPRAPRPIK